MPPRRTPLHLALAVPLLASALVAGPAAAQSTARWQGLAGEWTVLDPAGRPLGRIDLGVAGAIGGMGTIAGREVILDTRALAEGGVVLNLHRGIGDRSPGALFLSVDPAAPDRALRGTLVDGAAWTVVTLVRAAPGGAGPDDEPVIDDLPGVGVSGPPYRLRNPTADGWIGLYRFPRRDPNRDWGRIWQGEEDILVLECTPEVDSLAFEQAGRAGRLRILDRLWCRIEFTSPNGTGGSGWIEGRHLEPMWERIGPVP